MNRLALAATVAVAGILSLNAVHAADIARPVYKAPVVVPAFSWQGCYIGGNAGWIRNDSTVVTSPFGGLVGVSSFSYNFDGSDFAAGGQYGCNSQFGSWVLGLDSDFVWTGLNNGQVGAIPAIGGFPARTETITQKLDYYSTTRARIGYAFDRVMVYAAGGLASGKVDSSYTGVGAGLFLIGEQDKTRYGWTAGGGIEFALDNNWFLRGEYMYIDLGGYNYNALGAGGLLNVGLDNQFHVVRAGLSYRFTNAPSLWQWAAGGFR